MDGSGQLGPTIVTRADIVAAARRWVGTPYRHQASEHGVGADCLGLVRGVWRELYGDEPEPTPPYTPDWAERGQHEHLRDAARRHLTERPLDRAREGDVVLFRIRDDARAKHAGILTSPSRLVHAYWGRAVTETAVTPWWSRRRAYVFSFPGVID